MKNIEDVQVGDIAIDYCDAKYSVINTAKNYQEAMQKFPEQMCDYTSMLESDYVEEDEAVILVKSIEDNYLYIFVYGYDGAHVKE